MNLQDLKKKYSGQAIPDWELKQGDEAEKPRRGRPRSADPEADPQ